MRTILHLLAAVFTLALTADGSPNYYRITTVAGGSVLGADHSNMNDGEPALAAQLIAPSAVVLDSERNLWIAEQKMSRIRVVSASGSISTTDLPNRLSYPAGLAFENSGNLLIGDAGQFSIQRLSGSILHRIAGNGTSGYTGEGLPALESSLSGVTGVAAKANGGYYFADTTNHRIRTVNAEGLLVTVVGNGVPGFNGDHVGTDTQIDSPSGLALDASGNLYFADTGNNRIRKLMTDGNVITLKAGSLNGPRGVAVDHRGNVFISDTNNHRVVMLAADDSTTVVAGTGIPGFSGDGDVATAAQLSSPLGLFVDPVSGSLYVADSGNNRVRLLTSEMTISNPEIIVLNSATLHPGPFAACSLVTIFAPNVGALGTRVMFDGHAAITQAPVTDQITAEVPCDSENGSSVELSILYPDSRPITSTLSIVSAAPGLFTLQNGTGQAIATNQDGTMNSELNPTTGSSIVTLWATGVGRNNSLGIMFGSKPGTVLDSAQTPGMVGVTQINVQAPPDVTGQQSLILFADNLPSQAGVTLAITETSHQLRKADATHSTLSAGSTAGSVGPTNLTLSGTDGINAHTATMSLPVATFTMTAPATVSLTSGGTTAVTVAVSSSAGYMGTVTPTITSTLPAGVTASACSPATIQTSGSCVITLSATSTAGSVGPTNITFSGTDGRTAHTASTALSVIQARPAAPSTSVFMNVVINRLPTSGTTVNLSSATHSWRLFTPYLRANCNDCFGDTKLGGDGITGVRPIGTDNFFQSTGKQASALTLTYSDGTAHATGTGQNYAAFAGNQNYEIRAIADNATTKTFTSYWSISSQYVGTKTLSGDGIATFTFTMSDGSSPAQTIAVPSSSASENGLLKIVVSYVSATDGQELIMRGALTSGGSPWSANLIPIAATLDSGATGPIVRHIPLGSDLQSELNDMTRDGDKQQVITGSTWIGNFTIPPNRDVKLGCGLTLAAGLRIKQSEVCGHLLAPDGSTSSVISMGDGVRNVSIEGFEISTAHENGTCYSCILIQPTITPTMTIADLPHDISITHNVIHGEPVTLVGTKATKHNGDMRRGIATSGNRVLIQDNIIRDFYSSSDSIEANAITIQLGQNTIIDNNELTSNGEVVLTYEVGTYSQDMIPSIPGGVGLFPDHTTITNNYIHKPLEMAYIGYLKNMIEIKHGSNVLIANNLIENSFTGQSTDGQFGIGIAIANRSAGSNNPNPGQENYNAFYEPSAFWAKTEHIEVANNILHHVNQAFNVAGPYDDHYCRYLPGGSPVHCVDGGPIMRDLQASSIPKTYHITRGNDWNFHDNYVDDIDPIYGSYPGRGNRFGDAPNAKAACLTGPGGDNFVFRHNTCIFANGPIGTVLPAGTYMGAPYAAHTVSGADNTGWFVYAADFNIGNVVDSNILGKEIGGKCANGLIVIAGGGGGGSCVSAVFSTFLLHTITNNNIGDSYTDWTGDLNKANLSAPGQYTGNTLNVAPSGTQGVRNQAALLSKEPAIRAGNR